MTKFEQIAIVGGGIAAIVGLGFAMFYPYLMGSSRAEKRLKELKKGGSSPKRGQASGSRRDQVVQSLKEVEQRKKARNRLTLETLIGQAGLSLTRSQFYIYSLALGITLSTLSYLMNVGIATSIALLFIGALGLPRWILLYLRKKRLEKFSTEFPNAIDVIVRGIRSGLPIGDCLRIISTESAEPVRGEFRRIVEAQTLGLGVGEACSKLYERVPVAEANFFGIVVTIQQKAGGNLSEVLSNLSRVIRDRRKMRMKINAMSAEAKASAGIVGSIPVFVAIALWFLSPNHIMTLINTEAGNISLVICGLMMTTGVFVMKKMINLDI